MAETNEQLALKVIEATTAVQDAHDTVVKEGKKLIAHMDDPNAHGRDVDATAEAAAKAAVDAHDTASTPHTGKFAEAGHDHATISGNAATATLADLATLATLADLATRAETAALADLATRATSAASADAVPWNGISGKPADYPPEAHDHAAISGKAATATLADTATRATSAASADAVPWNGISGKPADYPPATHNHDTAYAAKAHQHSPNDLNAVVPVAKGGTGNTSGNAPTATKLQTARTIALTGGVTGSVNFDGSGNVNLSTTLTNLDASKITSGTLPAARGGTGRTDGRATALVTARTISLAGDVTGSANFDGSTNVSITAKAGSGLKTSLAERFFFGHFA